MIVRPAVDDDAVQAAYIYNHYIATSHATFELDPIDGREMLRRMQSGREAGYPFLVCEEANGVCGFAYASAHRSRPAYANTVEVSVYVKPGNDGLGIGSKLYESLLSELASDGFHAAIAGISLPNEDSVRLHEKFGFEKVAHFREVGRKFDRWFDVGYWQRILSKQ